MKYENLSTPDVENARDCFKNLNDSSIDFAFYCYSLYEQNPKELMELCSTEFDMSRSTIYKYVHVGRVIQKAEITLPHNFSAIAPLYKVLENLTNFNDWLDTPLVKMTTREIEKAIKEYYRENVMSEEERQEAETVDSTIESIVDASVDVKNKTDKINEKLSRLIETLQPVKANEITTALEIINEIQLLIGGNDAE